MNKQSLMTGHRSNWLTIAIISAVYLVIACLITWPLIAQLDTHLIGRTSDAMVHYWNGWWLQKAISMGQLPNYTEYLNFPDGVSLVTQNMAWFNMVPWLFLEPLAGGITAYNLIVLLSLVACGLSMFLLTNQLLHHTQAAFIAGLIYMAWPYRLSQLDHPNLVATFFVPIFLLFLIRTLQNLRWFDAVLAGVALALVGYTRWQLIIPAGVMAAVYLAGTIPQWREQWKRTFIHLLLLAAVAIVLLLPPALMLIQEQLSTTFATDLFFENDEQVMAVDLLAFFTPSNRHFILREYTRPLYDQFYPERSAGRRYPTYIGISVLFLAVIAVIKRWRSSWIWFVMAAMLAGLAVGMTLHINGRSMENLPTLYRLIAPLQIARLMRIPERFAMFMALPISILAAIGWMNVTATRRVKGWGPILTPLLGVIIIVEYLSLPAQMLYVDYDKQVLLQLAQEPGTFAVMNIPPRYRFSKEYMFEQTFHERPILQGHISREPQNLYRFIDENEWLSSLPELTYDPGFIMAQLHDAQVDYALFSKVWLTESQWRLWERHMPYAPYFEDDRFLVYATTPEIGRDLETPTEILPGLGYILDDPTYFCTSERIVAAARMTWASSDVLAEDYMAALTATSDTTGESIAAPAAPLVDGWPTSQWPAASAVRQAYSIELPADEAPFTLSLQIFEPGQLKPVGQTASIGQIHPDSCPITANDAQEAGVRFGEDVQLLGYEIEQDAGMLVLKLYWLAEQRPAASYKFFLHLSDPLSREVVGQVDAIPQNWQYPTSSWRAGELIADELQLSLTGLPSGAYELALGAYEAGSDQRLPITIINGEQTVTADNRLLLPETINIP